jgi:hypothetical protein
VERKDCHRLALLGHSIVGPKLQRTDPPFSEKKLRSSRFSYQVNLAPN